MISGRPEIETLGLGMAGAGQQGHGGDQESKGAGHYSSS